MNEAHSLGTSGGWVSCNCASTRTIQNASYVTRYVTPGDGAFARFQPASGIAMGYDDLKVVEAYHLVQSIATGQPHGATVADALVAAEIIEAMVESARNRRWVTLDEFVRTK